jgi:hypothetical protein
MDDKSLLDRLNKLSNLYGHNTHHWISKTSMEANEIIKHLDRDLIAEWAIKNMHIQEIDKYKFADRIISFFKNTNEMEYNVFMTITPEYIEKLKLNIAGPTRFIVHDLCDVIERLQTENKILKEKIENLESNKKTEV